MNGQKVLVTGASGFVGRAVAMRLSEAGYAVYGASRGQGPLPGCAQTRLMPPFGAPPAEFDALLEGVDHVVHCAGIARTLAGDTLERYIEVNAGLTEALARSATTVGVGRFVFMSSIRAVCGPSVSEVVTEQTPPAPTEDYGRSKLEAERRLSEIYGSDPRLTILRPTLVYGKGVGGILAAYSRMADLPLPLPFKSVKARRSLLDVDALADAVIHLLAAPRPIGGIYVVCDLAPVTAGEIISALRARRGRRPGLMAIPPAWLEKVFSLMGRRQAWLRLGEPLIADSSRLAATGWRPTRNTADRVAACLVPDPASPHARGDRQGAPGTPPAAG